MGFFFGTRQDKYGIAALLLHLDFKMLMIYSIGITIVIFLLFICQDIGFSLEFVSPTGEKTVSLDDIFLLLSVSYAQLVSLEAFLMLFFISHSHLQFIRPSPSLFSPFSVFFFFSFPMFCHFSFLWWLIHYDTLCSWCYLTTVTSLTKWVCLVCCRLCTN